MHRINEFQQFVVKNGGFVVSSDTLHPYDIFMSWNGLYAHITGLNVHGWSDIPDEAFDDRNNEYWRSEDCSYLISDILFEELNALAPEGYYFSCSDGDGACFGFWKSFTCPNCGRETFEDGECSHCEYSENDCD